MDHSEHGSLPTGLQWFGWTDRGKVRANNEDAFLGLQFDAQEVHRLGKFGEASTQSSDFAFAVSDGMGGAMAGEYASRIAVEKITTLLPRSFRRPAAGLDADFDTALTKLFREIHRALVYVGNSYEECAGMETTLSVGWFTPGRLYFGHVGDSRIYHLPARSGAIRQISQDDTHVGWLVRNGKLNEREARAHPRRNVLQKALGGGNQFMDPQVGMVPYASGDAFLLCSDGLTEGLSNDRLAELLKPAAAGTAAENPAHNLVLASLANDGRDNTTALVIRAV